MAIVFDTANKVIGVGSPATEVTVQNLINAIRDFEDSPEGMTMASIAKAAGKEDLGGGVSVGITLELINDWRIQFEERTDWINCYIKGGNLVATNSYDNDPIKPSAYVSVVISQSSSAVSITTDDDNPNKQSFFLYNRWR